MSYEQFITVWNQTIIMYVCNLTLSSIAYNTEIKHTFP